MNVTIVGGMAAVRAVFPGIAAALLAACASTTGPAPGVPDDPAAAFAAVEQRLLEAESVAIEARMTVFGAIAADLAGSAALATGNRARLAGDGVIANRTAVARFVSDGERMRGVSGTRQFTVDTPDGLNRSILLAITRMGLFHNLSRLSAGAQPDRPDGTIDDIISVDELAFGPDREIDGANTRAVKFRIVFGGSPTGDGTLWLDERTGLPVRREHRLEFSHAGFINLIEEYTILRLNGPLAAEGYEIGAAK